MNKRFRIVALGEVLWDVFPDGPRFGGAPANVACHAAALGAAAWIVSRVGDDQLGRRALDALREHGVQTENVAAGAEFPTGTVQVELDAAGKPRFTIRENVAWDEIEWSENLEKLSADCNAVCFGTLGQRSARSRETIRRFLAATPPSALRILDINLRPPFYDDDVILESMRLANGLKLNDEELPVVARIAGLKGTDAGLLEQIRERFQLEIIALTRGDEGALLLRGGEVHQQPGVATEVVDTVGAGDAYTAAMILGLLDKLDLETINRRACRVAAFVCSQAGATPKLPEGS